MTATATATTVTAAPPLAPTAQQRQMIIDLASELGRDIEVPASRKAASMVIAKAIADKQVIDGDKPAPTRRQVRLLERLGNERGRSYQIPATRKQAAARISQILNSNRPATPAAA